jgi:cysteine desulfurase/selenocysteine lyase
VTVLPSPGQDGFDPTDEAFVGRLANHFFREGPQLTDLVATEAEHLDSVPGRTANSIVDLAAATARAGYRSDPAMAAAMPADAIPHPLPGALGLPASRPSSFILRSAPLGMEVPAKMTDPWRHVASYPWLGTPIAGGGRVAQRPDAPGPMSSAAAPVEIPRGLEHGSAADSLSSHGRGPAWPSMAPDATSSSLYFLEPRSVPDLEPVTQRAGSAPDAAVLRRDFPALQQEVHGKRLIWLDNASTTQKPRSVIDAVSRFYEHDNSNVHRGAHELAARATDAYEGARSKVAALLGASSPDEVIFVRGTTEAINLVAQSYGRSAVGEGDEIVLTTLEHHSNIIPWQLLAEETGATLKPVEITDRGDVLLDHYASLLGPRTRIVALSHVSNALGTILPVEAMAAMARAVGAVVVVDGAQGVPHLPVDVQALGADFYAFSGHKLYGPTGVGALWGRRALLEAMPPWQGGGQMIKTVTFESTTWNDLPYKFEAGTGAIGPAVGLGAAIDYVTQIGLPHIAAHEQALLAYGTELLAGIPGLRLIGTSAHKAGVMSFVLDGADVTDVAKFLDHEGIAVRAGHHCAQPALRSLGLDGTVRPSLGLYNTHDDLDALAAAVEDTETVNERAGRYSLERAAWA